MHRFTVNANGTAGGDLLMRTERALAILQEATSALQNCAPQPRDYPGGNGANDHAQDRWEYDRCLTNLAGIVGALALVRHRLASQGVRGE